MSQATAHRERLIGLDLARGVAVLGMFTAHIGPEPEDGGAVLQVAHGRSAALFALLAGVALVIISGRRRPRTGREGRQAAVKVAIRAVVLLVLGTAVAMIPSPVDVILAYYGLYFLLALPLLRLSATMLAVLAAGLAVVGPLVSFGVRGLLDDGSWVVSRGRAVNAHDPIEWLSHEGVIDLLLTGAYPAMTWMPYVLAGMALGRLDLKAARVRRRLAVLGPALALVGYGSSWLVLRVFAGIRADIEGSGWYDADPSAWWAGPETGTVDPHTPALLLVAAPHSGTPFEVVANIGVAITVVVCAVTVADLRPRAPRPLRPVIAVGTMSLSCYVGHILALAALDTEATPSRLSDLVVFVVAALALAVMWTRRFRRGPLEFLLNTATKPARHVR
ncbi:DUF418 domain-containing protein [Actinomadura spongiicola]|uniref:DUF418 domain-containing protein n=1 Tax=Actinomadura spongiicola TaxID=2303421 RepID=UPI0018F1B39F|nr:DUF418 domain-containing protein [Actinomadura spongiicola]